MRFLDRLAPGQPQLGLWQALANPYTAEICARSGFDWLLFDGEHAPNTVQTLLAQLQAVAPFQAEPIARVPVAEPVYLKQYLDIGFKTLLLPMIDTDEQAKDVVAATRFPPVGIRGVASATSRASGFGAEPEFLHKTAASLTLIAQIESAQALDNVEAIAAVEGIDALFIGPADLASSLGHLGNPKHSDVQAAIARALTAIKAAGKPAGIFALSPEDASAKIADGFSFVSVGTDIGLLANGGRSLLGQILPR